MRSEWRWDATGMTGFAAVRAALKHGVTSFFAVPEPEEELMAVAKVVTIIGNSTESFAKAADAAVQEAAKTIRDITGADVVSMSAAVENGRISQYKTTVNIAFAVEGTD
jgi:flavin-binding protein dodecin